MANPLRKTMVYLGLADEEFDYEDDASAQQPASTQHRDGQQRDGQYRDGPQPVQHAPVAQHPASATNAGRAPVTPLRRTANTRNAAPVEMNEILTVHPRQYKDAQIIAESFRDGIPVIINLSQMTEGEARRLVDFASGLSTGLHGKIERVTKQVFLLSPQHVLVSGDPTESESDVDASFFAAH